MEPSITRCIECGAETDLFRADFPYCVDCVDLVRPIPNEVDAEEPELQGSGSGDAQPLRFKSSGTTPRLR